MTLKLALYGLDARLYPPDPRFVICGGNADETEIRAYVREPMPDLPGVWEGYPLVQIPIESIRYDTPIEEKACETSRSAPSRDS